MARTRKTAARARFAERIKAVRERSVKGILEQGRLLLAAKNKLDHDEFTKLVERDLGYTERTGQRYVAIGKQYKRLATHVSLLPPCWGTIYELARLTDEQFESLLRDGLLRPDLERSELRVIVEGWDSHDLAALAEEHRRGHTMVLAPVAPTRPETSVSLTGYARHLVRPADRIERHLPEINFAELARRARAKNILESLLTIWRESQAHPDIEEIVDLLLAPANADKLDGVRRAISFVITIKGALDQRGLRGNPTLRLIESDPKVP